MSGHLVAGSTGPPCGANSSNVSSPSRLTSVCFVLFAVAASAVGAAALSVMLIPVCCCCHKGSGTAKSTRCLWARRGADDDLIKLRVVERKKQQKVVWYVMKKRDGMKEHTVSAAGFRRGLGHKGITGPPKEQLQVFKTKMQTTASNQQQKGSGRADPSSRHHRRPRHQPQDATRGLLAPARWQTACRATAAHVSAPASTTSMHRNCHTQADTVFICCLFRVPHSYLERQA